MKNLDALCAYTAIEIEKLYDSLRDNKKKTKLLNNITNSISILQEDGIYAFFLFLKRENIAAEIWPICKKLLQKEDIGRILPDDPKLSDEQAIIKMTEEMDHLFLSKDLLQRMLIYSRHGMRS